jgi:hypothetical protein
MRYAASIETTRRKGRRSSDTDALDCIIEKDNSKLDRLMAAIDSTLDESTSFRSVKAPSDPYPAVAARMKPI